jgi:hypothetical protein
MSQIGEVRGVDAPPGAIKKTHGVTYDRLHSDDVVRHKV